METNQDQNPQQQQSHNQGQPYYQQQYAPVDNLNTFSILHIVKGVLTLLFSLFFIVYAFFGTMMFSIIEANDDPHMPFNPGSIFLVIGIVGFVITVVMGILTLLAAKYLKARKNYTFVFAIAILNCVSGILGILLGVFTIIELTKPHIKASFDQNNSTVAQ